MNNSNHNNECGNFFLYMGSFPGSPASKSDLRIGDKILSINGVVLKSIDDWYKAIMDVSIDRVIEVLRGNKIISIKIDLVKTKFELNNMN